VKKANWSFGLQTWTMEADKKYPRTWWESSGRILVDNNEAKTMVARKIAKAIKEARGG
jgi:signal recognition particle subunit SRP19